MIKHTKLLSLFLAGALSAACNEEDFQRRDTKAIEQTSVVTDEEPTPEPEEIPVPPEASTESFALGFERGAIDMVWVIDNSESMDAEAAQVRANFTKFVNALGSATKLKLALISQKTGPTGVDLSVVAPGSAHVQQDVRVYSNNPLAILASAICPKQAAPADAANLTVCGRDFSAASRNDKARTTVANAIYTVSGQLNGFFRPNAKRVFVTVTDDDAVLVNHTNFLDLIKPTLPEAPYMFAFRGVVSNAATNCTIAAPGAAYNTLSQATKGEGYDICDADWSQHFSKLTDSVESIATTTFKLKMANVEVITVKIDGVDVPKELYELTGDSLAVKPEAFQGKQKIIEVFYKPI